MNIYHIALYKSFMSFLFNAVSGAAPSLSTVTRRSDARMSTGGCTGVAANRDFEMYKGATGTTGQQAIVTMKSLHCTFKR